MIFLSAMLSITLVDAENVLVAPALSPAAMALRTDLIAVRSFERRLELWALRLTVWRARLRAEAMLAMRKSWKAAEPSSLESFAPAAAA